MFTARCGMGLQMRQIQFLLKRVVQYSCREKCSERGRKNVTDYLSPLTHYVSLGIVCHL